MRVFKCIDYNSKGQLIQYSFQYETSYKYEGLFIKYNNYKGNRECVDYGFAKYGNRRSKWYKMKMKRIVYYL